MSDRRKRRTPAEVVASLEDPADVAVYLSARIKVCQATEQDLFELCPPEATGLLKQLLTPRGS